MPIAAKQQRKEQLDRAISDLIATSRGEAPIEPPPEDRLLRIWEVLEYVHVGKTKLQGSGD
jgi:hypothetical protein